MGLSAAARAVRRAAALALGLAAACGAVRADDVTGARPPSPAASSAAASAGMPAETPRVHVDTPADAPPDALPADCPPPVVSPAPEALLQGQRDAVDSGFLWRLRRGGRTSWLYGTMHAARFAWMFPGPTVREALQSSDVVAFEMDVLDPDVLARLQRVATRTPRTPTLPVALAARLDRVAVAACVPPATLAGLRPELRAVSVSLGAGRRLGLETAWGIDLQLAGLAHGLGKDVRSLETPEAQMSLLVSDDPAEVAASVAETLDEVERGDAVRQLARLALDWREGRLEDLADYAAWCGCIDTPARRRAFTRMVDDRNPAMARQLAAWHARGRSVFMAVGSLHMVGPRGLPRLLAAEGFDVERVAIGAPAGR